MNRPARRLWGLVTIGGATAVGITTRDPGFVIITLVGGLALPRILGVHGHGHGHLRGGACAGRHAGRSRFEDRMAEWHRQAHGDAPPPPRDPAPVA
ncbi:MAG TPA: hypothetical protein VGQ42_17045 [Candidatus Dormibacteraeota bacterium]|jgi:hypothetical protein|nr:hypothetical protein [Candidatus Dormibacteraeota bacterium]